MPAGAVIGALRVILGADTAAFDKGLSTAEKRAEKFGRAIGVGLRAAATAGVAAGAALTIAIKGALNEADKLTKLAQSIGVPVDELSRLKHAADLSGVGIDGLAKGVQRLARNLVEAEQGLSTPIRAFEALGIEVRNVDGSIKTVSEVLPELAERFKNLRDGPEKTALAMQLLGRAGADMIPLLNAGADGLRAMMNEADELGIVINERTGRAAEMFNDNLDRLSKVFGGIVTQITAQLAPGLATLTTRMVEFAKDGGRAKAIADGIVSAFRFVAKEAASTVLFIVRLGAELEALVEVAKTLKSPAAFFFGDGSAWEKFREEGKKTEEMFASLGGTIDGLFRDTVSRAEQFRIAFGETMPGAVNKSNVAIFNATEQKKLLNEAEREHNRLVAEGISVTLANLTPQEQLAEQLAYLNDLLNRGVISWETYNRASQFAADQVVMAWATAAGNLGNVFSEISGIFGKEGGAIAKTASVLGAVQALISTFVGQAKALELPFPANLAAAAAILAKGLGIVAAIKSTKVPSFAHGGSFEVGGVGGLDRNRVVMDLTRGERVTVDPIGGGGAGGGGTLTIDGVRPDFFYQGDRIRDMVDAFNFHFANGGKKLKLA